jgi:hypothetical protein
VVQSFRRLDGWSAAGLTPTPPIDRNKIPVW